MSHFYDVDILDNLQIILEYPCIISDESHIDIER